MFIIHKSQIFILPHITFAATETVTENESKWMNKKTNEYYGSTVYESINDP